MTDDELRSLVAQNSQDIAGTRQNLNALIEGVIKPMVESTTAFESRMDEIAQRSAGFESRMEELAQRSAEIAQRSAENVQRSTDSAVLFHNLLAEAREDRMNNQKRFDEQQEVIRALLLRITNIDGEASEEA